MDAMFKNKVLLITGSSRGIGAATARLAKQYGAELIVHGKTQSEHLAMLAQELDALPIVCDVADKQAVETAVKDAISKKGKIDGLINSAGIAASIPFLETDDEHWETIYRTNVLGTVHMCQVVIPHMRERGGGRIVNIASIRGHANMASNRGMAYSASKAAVIALTATLAKEFAPNIAVNAVSPGFTATDISKGWNETVWNQVKQSLIGRVAKPEEIAEALLFLASERASFITGQTVIVDGGYGLAGK